MIYDVKNGVKTLKSKKEYKYDVYGNMTEEKEYTASNKSMITYLFYDTDSLNITEIKKEETSKRTDNNGTRLVTEYTYDYAGNLIKEKDNNGVETKLEYDMASRNISVTKPNGNKVLYEYDSFNRIIKESIPFTQNDTSIKYYEYDKAGNLTLEGIKGSASLNGERNRYYEYNSL